MVVNFPITYSVDYVIIGAVGKGVCNTEKTDLSTGYVEAYKPGTNSQIMAVSIGT